MCFCMTHVRSCTGNLMQIWVMALAFAAIAPIILPFALLWCASPASITSTPSRRAQAVCLEAWCVLDVSPCSGQE